MGRPASSAARATPTISLLTDYGWEDGFVGAVHSVLRRRLPDVALVDLTHGIAAHDVRAGSLALKRAAPYLADGVVLAIVDPGVGTARRCVAVKAGQAHEPGLEQDGGRDGNPDVGGAPRVAFVGPDNGLMVPAIDALGGALSAVELEDRGYWLRAPGPTFAGRDILAPAAAHLAAGGEIMALGRAIDPLALTRLPAPVCCRREDGSLQVEVTWVDRFGNVQLAAGPADLPGDGRGLESVGVATPLAGDRRSPGSRGEPKWTARLVQAFGDLGPGELGLLVDSCGSLALCLFGASAADRVGVAERDLLILSVHDRPPTT